MLPEMQRWARENAPDLDGPVEDPADLAIFADVMRKFYLYLLSRSEAERHERAGNHSTAAIIRGDMRKTYESLPEWARWGRKTENRGS